MRIKTTAKQLERLASWGYLKQMADGSWTIVLKHLSGGAKFSDPLENPWSRGP